MNCDGEDCGQDPALPRHPGIAEQWIESELDHMLGELQRAIEAYRFDRASQLLYDFIWNEYCDWYLELCKVALRSDDPAAQRAVRRTLVTVLERALRALHPFMPFITEEIWQSLRGLAGCDGETIVLQPFPRPSGNAQDGKARDSIGWLKEFALAVRTIRGEMNIPPGKKLPVLLRAGDGEDPQRVEALTAELQQIAGIVSISWLGDEQAPAAATGLCGELEILVPWPTSSTPRAELARLEKEIDKAQRELQRLAGKLDNASFVERAPAEVVEREREKLQSQQNGPGEAAASARPAAAASPA
jgi:valyl-tRNA synthetase